jgi:hypothetical protein
MRPRRVLSVRISRRDTPVRGMSSAARAHGRRPHYQEHVIHTHRNPHS